MHRYIWLIPLLPLIGAGINGLLGRTFRFSEKVIGTVAVGSVALAFVLGLGAVYSYGYGERPVWPNTYVTSEDGWSRYTWIPGGAFEITEGRAERARAGLAPGGASFAKTGRGALLDIEWSYQLDPLSAVFLLIVTGVGLCIFIFATGYMHGDKGYYRFFAYLGLFMFSMLLLVLGSNFLMLFAGWEGVGLCSYLLIGYYFDREEAGDASRKAFITNRIGDFGFALAVFAVIATFGTAQYTSVMEQARAYPVEALGTWSIMSWIALGLFVGACGKSAQFPLHVWLPDAMAGPTPVSALIHAATMVTAGLYMVTRTNVIFQHSQTMMLVVAIVGTLTAIFAATIGITQNDIKKVLAYSTISQLGFMFLACGVGAFAGGIFHVTTHAFFKGLLFLGAGSVLHAMHHEQDMRRMGNLRKYMPYTYWTFFAGWLAICGIIPFSGFWSKDEILWNTASSSYIPGGWILWIVGIIAAVCTAFYMTRLVAMTFWGRERFPRRTAGGEADEAYAHGVDEGLEPHIALTESAGDRPRHEPGEFVGVAYEEATVHEVGGQVVRDDERGRGAPHKYDQHDYDLYGHDAHEHGEPVPHESPPSMWIPLVVLAILATIGGFVGISPAVTGGVHVGGRFNIANWLEPVVWNPATREFGRKEAHAFEGTNASLDYSNTAARKEGALRGEAGSGGLRAVYGDTGFNLAHAAERSLGNGAELLFVFISLLAAGLGIGGGYLFYVKNPHWPNVWAMRLRPLYRASLNKYWIDELYGLLFTRRTMDAARAVHAIDAEAVDGAVNGAAGLTRRASLLSGAFDKYVVDGLVNGIAVFIRDIMSNLLRAAQTGLTQNYALVMVIGLAIAVVLFFGKDILAAMRGISMFF